MSSIVNEAIEVLTEIKGIRQTVDSPYQVKAMHHVDYAILLRRLSTKQGQLWGLYDQMTDADKDEMESDSRYRRLQGLDSDQPSAN